MRKTLFGLMWGVILMATGPELASASPPCPPQQAKTVRIGHQSWRVQVAFSPKEREQGLSGREHIPAGTAMWFVLPEPGFHGFWMQDMAFPLDLVWITPQGRVAGVETLAPCGPAPCPIHTPPEPVGFVLETTAGEVPDLEGKQVRWICNTD
jgi:uncharacterized membrane protein (UPF0127 family)